MRTLFLQIEQQDLAQEVATVSGQFRQNLEELVEGIIQNRGNILWGLFLIIVVVLLAKILLKVVSWATGHTLKSPKYQGETATAKRTRTLMTLLRSVARYIIYFIALLIVLSILGMGEPLSNLLITAGVGSLAIGFGAQSLVKDVISGMFMIFENQFSVGDYIKIDDVEGTVEATAMRVTYLRSAKGDQIIIPNGSITRVINYNKGNAVASVTLPISYEADTAKVLDLIDLAVSEYARQHPDLTEEKPQVLGVTAMKESNMEVNITCKVKPMKQWAVERGIRLAVKEMFDRSGVPYPYPRVVTVPHEKPGELVSREDIFVAPDSKAKMPAKMPAKAPAKPSLWEEVDPEELED